MLLPAYWSGKDINRCELSGQMGVQKCIWKEEWYLWLKIGKKQREKKKSIICKRLLFLTIKINLINTQK